MLEAGYNPMKFFANDFKKYFYLAELYSLIDLSSVSASQLTKCDLNGPFVTCLHRLLNTSIVM